MRRGDREINWSAEKDESPRGGFEAPLGKRQVIEIYRLSLYFSSYSPIRSKTINLNYVYRVRTN